MMRVLPLPPVAAPRILFVCDADTSAAASALEACHRLCDALASAGLHPVVLQAWPATTQAETRHAAKVQERPYPVYCSRTIRAEANLLALVEQPTLAITLGVDPIGLAQPLLDGGLPCIAWFVDASSFQSLPSGPVDRRLGLAGASHALAAQLSVLAGAPVSTLLPPLLSHMQLSNGGDAVLVPSIRRVDGIHRVLEMARARPHILFVAIARADQAAAAQSLRSSAPSNVAVLDADRAAQTLFRMAVLPSLNADLPWDMLAHCLTAHLPVLASSESLLEDAVGDAGRVVPTSQPLEAWLDALDQMFEGDITVTSMAHAAGERASSLRITGPAGCAAVCPTRHAARQVVGSSADRTDLKSNCTQHPASTSP